jgi:hypothetical protein
VAQNIHNTSEPITQYQLLPFIFLIMHMNMDLQNELYTYYTPAEREIP